MTGTQLAIGEASLVGFVLAVTRIAGFVLVTPPFNTRAVPAQARVGLVFALALPVAPAMTAGAPRLDSTDLLVDILLQGATGLALGFLVLAAVAAIQAAGDLLDVVGGFSISMAMDPLMLTQTSVMGRLHQFLAAALLFVTDGHLVILHGLTRTVQLMPDPHLSWNDVARAVTAAVEAMFLGALQIAAPVIAALLVADVALGLLTRAAPALNAFSLSYPIKIFFTLLLAGLVISRLPEALEQSVSHQIVEILQLVTPSAAGGSGGTGGAGAGGGGAAAASVTAAALSGGG